MTIVINSQRIWAKLLETFRTCHYAIYLLVEDQHEAQLAEMVSMGAGPLLIPNKSCI